MELTRWKRAERWTGLHTYARYDRETGAWRQIIPIVHPYHPTIKGEWIVSFRLYETSHKSSVLRNEKHMGWRAAHRRAKEWMAQTDEIVMEEVL